MCPWFIAVHTTIYDVIVDIFVYISQAEEKNDLVLDQSITFKGLMKLLI